MEEELKHLEFTLKKYDEVIDDSNLKIEHLSSIYRGNYEGMLEEKFRLESLIKSIQNAKLAPYFARIDFESSETKDICYIGKLGVSDYDNNIITVDWRAPISSLYYDSNVGKCSYNAPDGVIEGNLLLKRQYEIQNSKLLNFNDVDTVSTDELLKPYLSVSADTRLKNIVSTIQSEQNRIIRENINKNLVIQGVAGSGKTTVALHRIAYLAYNYRYIYKSKDYMVIGPNKFFVNYISSILPDLAVNNVPEVTIEELFLNYMNDNYQVTNYLDKLKDNDDISKFKISKNLVEKIDNYFNNLEIIPNEDFKINDIVIVNKSMIKDMYLELNNSIFENVNSKVQRLIILINKYIDNNKDKIISKLIKNNINSKIINEVKNNINYHLKKYFKVVNINPKNIYIEILKENNIDLKDIKSNILDIEDIPPLIYIKYKLFGSNEFDQYRHIVIDEAQDYGWLCFYALRKIFKNATFSIYGDLAQSLYSYRSIESWNSLENIFDRFEILKLDKSYRTTIEIMNEANKINKLLNLDEAIPVIRHGDNVEYLDNINIMELVSNLKEKYKSIAIITKNQEDANKLFEELKNNLEFTLINSNNLSYENDVIVLPNYLSKGLEFDAVIILDLNKYDKNNISDMKLLYVSMTRALHKLYVVR